MRLRDPIEKRGAHSCRVQGLRSHGLKNERCDLRKLIELQNSGDITRIYTYAMAGQFEKDLVQLKAEGGL